MAEGEAAIKQAKSASQAAEQLLKQEKAEKEEDQQKEANVSNEIKELKEGKKILIHLLVTALCCKDYGNSSSADSSGCCQIMSFITIFFVRMTKLADTFVLLFT